MTGALLSRAREGVKTPPVAHGMGRAGYRMQSVGSLLPRRLGSGAAALNELDVLCPRDALL